MKGPRQFWPTALRSATRRPSGQKGMGLRALIVAVGFAALAAVPLIAAIQEPIKVEGGLISGTPSWGWGVRLYRGIPFAAPPVGNLRWRPPQPVIPWNGVRKADRFSPDCMQRERPVDESMYNDTSTRHSEDCLYLNIWTPARSASDKLPVMLWIFGGGGLEGSGAMALYDGNGLAKKGVVLVTINNRLNVFGWLAHPELTRESEHHASGNYGSLDQIAAIRWVKDNIGQFGGDPDKITVFGHSFGSRSVNWLMASPLAKGLFRGAIGESHAAFGRMATLAEAEAQGVKFAQGVGARSLADLRKMPAEELLAAALKTPGAGSAIVDGWFLPEDVYTIFAAGKQNDVALMTGGTNDEGGWIGNAPPPDTPEKYVAWSKTTFGDQAEAILKAYPAATDAGVKKAYHDLARDSNFIGHWTWVKMQTTTGKSPAYLYLFSHVPGPSAGDFSGYEYRQPARNDVGRINSRPIDGAAHGVDVFYVFDNLRFVDWPWTSFDRKLAEVMTSYWSNFAKNLDPNGAGLTRWPAYSPHDERFLNIDDPIRVENINRAALDAMLAREEKRRHPAPSGF